MGLYDVQLLIGKGQLAHACMRFKCWAMQEVHGIGCYMLSLLPDSEKRAESYAGPCIITLHLATVVQQMNPVLPALRSTVMLKTLKGASRFCSGGILASICKRQSSSGRIQHPAQLCPALPSGETRILGQILSSQHPANLLLNVTESHRTATMMTASTIKPLVAAPSASTRARPARAHIACSAHKVCK